MANSSFFDLLFTMIMEHSYFYSDFLLKLSLQHEALSAVQLERDRLHSTLHTEGHMTENEIIQQAHQERDFAIEK